ncbi:MAG: S9 family peptidase [Gammaproteobacteria bacterium]|nr:S9 family peptidase [Gammaproteobacteria bacterium]
MFRRASFIAVAILGVSGGVRAEKLTLERLYAAPDLSGATLRSAQISPDGRLVAYLRGKPGNAGQLDLWAYDIKAGRHRLLVDSAVLESQPAGLSAEESQRRERQRSAAFSGIVEYQFSRDSRFLLVPLGGDIYVYDLRAAPDKAVRRITNTDDYETDARFSPRGRYLSFVRNRNLVIYDLQRGAERTLTTGGGGLLSFATAEFIAQEEMGRYTGYWWSPDDRRIAYTRVDESPVAEAERFEIMADKVEVVRQRYPEAGGHNALVELYVTDIATPAPKRVDLGADPDFYLARVDWFPDASAIAVQRQSRDQKTLTLLAADPVSGTTRELLTESADAWVSLNDELTFLEDSPQFIWSSSRSGYRHLYLYQRDGTLVRALTGGAWNVVGDGGRRALKAVDEKRGLVYFTANIDSPVERQLYSVSMRKPAAGPRRLTEGAGWHSVTMSEDAQVFLDTFSTPEQPPSVTLRSATGTILDVMVPNELNAGHPYAPYLDEHAPTEFGTLKAPNGEALHYQITRPRVLEPGRRYPVIVEVYGGPESQTVRRAWGSSARSNGGFFRQILARNGYIVFSLDNRGTGYRGVAFETALYRKMGSVEVEDQVRGVEFLRTLPYVDPARIGIFGWSYGGYMALMCAMQAPGYFAAAVAGAPVTSWQRYDTHYTERYMGTPLDNPEGYAAGTVMNHAAGLQAPLLVIHGMADDNVLFTNSTALFQRLQELGKPFDIMVYPGGKHGVLRMPGTGRHAYEAIMRFFADNLQQQ